MFLVIVVLLRFELPVVSTSRLIFSPQLLLVPSMVVQPRSSRSMPACFPSFLSLEATELQVNDQVAHTKCTSLSGNPSILLLSSHKSTNSRTSQKTFELPLLPAQFKPVTFLTFPPEANPVKKSDPFPHIVHLCKIKYFKL